MIWKNNHDRTLITDLRKHSSDTVRIKGRVAEVRNLGGIIFLEVIDRTGICQIVLDKHLKDIPQLQSVIACEGSVVPRENVPGGFEIHTEKIDILSEPVIELPFNPKKLPSPLNQTGPNPETLFNHRSLSLRSLAHQAIFKVGSEVLAEIDNFLRKYEFLEIKTPKIVKGGTEGGAGLFEVKYFERIAFLAQSPQLYKQSLASSPIERVFEIAPAFRAEKHSTNRHINEFTSIDVEMAYLEGMEDLMDIQQDMMKSVIDYLSSNCQKEIAELKTELPSLKGDIPRLDLDEAKEIITGKRSTRTSPAVDLSPDEERAICQWSKQEYGCEAVFIHSFPTSKRPFYTMHNPENKRKSLSFDLIIRGLEISSGSIRVHDPKLLEENLQKKGLSPDSMKFYVDIFRLGCPPHGGFGIGLERLLQKLLDLPNIRYACLFPRDRQRIEP